VLAWPHPRTRQPQQGQRRVRCCHDGHRSALRDVPRTPRTDVPTRSALLLGGLPPVGLRATSLPASRRLFSRADRDRANPGSGDPSGAARPPGRGCGCEGPMAGKRLAPGTPPERWGRPEKPHAVGVVVDRPPNAVDDLFAEVDEIRARRERRARRRFPFPLHAARLVTTRSWRLTLADGCEFLGQPKSTTSGRGKGARPSPSP
jgi:hypothetical protein